MVRLLPALRTIMHPLLHWSSANALEVMLLPPRLFHIVSAMIQSSRYPCGSDMESIALHGLGIMELIRYDSKISSGVQISATLKCLLTKVLKLAQACTGVGAPNLAKPFVSDISKGAFEIMVRSGTFTTHSHRVVRTLPAFHVDNKNLKARERAAKRKAADEEGEETEGCTKYKTSHRALTPGLFLCFCAGCGICEVYANYTGPMSLPMQMNNHEFNLHCFRLTFLIFVFVTVF